MAFTNKNSRYETDTTKGHPHGAGQPKGSVFDQPLFADPSGYTLWLEHVVEVKSGDETYWLMWYDGHGNPTTKVSGVIPKESLRDLGQRLIQVP